MLSRSIVHDHSILYSANMLRENCDIILKESLLEAKPTEHVLSDIRFYYFPDNSIKFISTLVCN